MAATAVALAKIGLSADTVPITWFSEGQDLIGVIGGKCSRRAGVRLPPALKVLFGSNQVCIIPLQVYIWNYKRLSPSQLNVKKTAASTEMSKLKYMFQRAYSNYVKITFVKVIVT